MLQSVGAALSLELRNTSSRFLEILDLSLTAYATRTVALLCLSILVGWAASLLVSLFHFLSSFYFLFSFFLFLSFV